LAYAANINEAEVKLQEIGFTQAAAIQQGAVDGAIVYLANEPVQLRRLGLETQVILVSDYIDLVSNGLVAGDKLIAEQPELVQKMVRATLRGLQYSIDHPDEAFTMARTIIPEMTDADAPTQREVLDTSIELWRSEQPGHSDRESWQESVDFMTATGMLEGTQRFEVY
jgi:NitT/TauT family transport system substrate-binding protein